MKCSYLFAVIIIFILGSCSQDVETEPFTPSRSDLLDLKSHDEFETVVEKVAQMSEQELDAWEKRSGFISFRTAVNIATMEWEEMTSVEEQNSFLQKYSHLFVLQDSILTSRISIHLYRSISNEDGIYTTDRYLHKVVGDFIITAERHLYDQLKEIQSALQIPAELESEVKIFRYAGSAPQDNSRAKSLCGVYTEASYLHNETNCRNDRKVVISGDSYILLSRTWEGDWRQRRVRIEARGYTKYTALSTWCKWYSYKTSLHFRNVSFSMLIWKTDNGISFPSYYEKKVADESTPIDDVYLRWDGGMEPPVLNQIIIPSGFFSLHAEATSRGVDGQWAVLDCRF